MKKLHRKPWDNPRTTWGEANRAEHDFWTDYGGRALTVLHSMRAYATAVELAERARPELTQLRGSFAEIGVGPVGIGCIHFFSGSRDSELVGVDPLPYRQDNVHHMIAAMRDALNHRYTHVNRMGEATGLPSEYFDLVVTYNCLDHCNDAEEVLGECYRILKPFGYFFLGCDVHSLAGRFRLRHFISKKKHYFLVAPHTAHFSQSELESMVKRVGFDILKRISGHSIWWDSTFGRAKRCLLVAQRKAAK